jgi:hypothetical protein
MGTAVIHSVWADTTVMAVSWEILEIQAGKGGKFLN